MGANENKNYFIKEWLVSGPSCTLYNCENNTNDVVSDQLRYEKNLRKNFKQAKTTEIPNNIKLNESEDSNLKWEYYCNEAGNSIFVDKSFFYSNPTLIELDAATIINCNTSKTVSATLFTYACIDVYLNGKKVANGTPPVYKPIKKSSFNLNLQQGENLLYVKMSNLGIRDSRTMFAIALDTSDVNISLPDKENTACLMQAKEQLYSLTYSNGEISFNTPVSYPTYLIYKSKKEEIKSNNKIKAPKDTTMFYISIETPSGNIKRKLETLDSNRAMYKKTNGAPLNEILKALANVESQLRGSGAYFSAHHVLARYALGLNTKNDEKLIRNDLKFIDSRGDCADFLVAAIVRLIIKYKIDVALYSDIKESLLNFRYWMDEPGSDGMCFWSENHALMFHGSQLILSDLFKDDVFTNCGKTGEEIYPQAKRRCLEWLDDIESEDFEEFNSATYVPVTVAALLNIVDFAPQDMSKRASKLLDKIFNVLCRHVFDGTVITPQGRVYRDVIIPYEQTVQTILYIIDSNSPFPKEPLPFVSMFGTTKYTLPHNLLDIIYKDYSIQYTTGRTQVNLEKNKNYILTSVDSPANMDIKYWDNIYEDVGANKDSYAFTKSLNECFHGTSHFRPGTYGYQQHLWSAALNNECIVFVNHPGNDIDGGGMRPGYWYGNLITPALKQNNNILGAIYSIPLDNPIAFTHVFWPTAKFDEWCYEDNWLLGKTNSGYIGLWCSDGLEQFNGSVLQNCEYRCSNIQSAYVCICEEISKTSDLKEFLQTCKNLTPQFDKTLNKLSICGNDYLTYKNYDDKTQYV